MNDFVNKHPEIITGIFTILGVIIGWGLQFFASCIKNRAEKIAEVKKTVFLALTLWDILYRSRIEEFTNTYLKLLRKKYPNISKKQENEIYKSFIQTILWNFLDEENLNKIEDVGNTFESTIKNLSGFDPIAAYKLHGSKDIIRLSIRYRDWAFDFKSKFMDTLNKEQLSNYNERIFTTSAKVVNDALKEIDKLIFGLTLRYDIFRYVSIKIMIKKQKMKFEKQLKEGFDVNIANFKVPESETNKANNAATT